MPALAQLSLGCLPVLPASDSIFSFSSEQLPHVHRLTPCSETSAHLRDVQSQTDPCSLALKAVIFSKALKASVVFLKLDLSQIRWGRQKATGSCLEALVPCWHPHNSQPPQLRRAAWLQHRHCPGAPTRPKAGTLSTEPQGRASLYEQSQPRNDPACKGRSQLCCPV